MTTYTKFTGNSNFNPQPKPIKADKPKKTKIKPRSEKRSKEEKVYSTLREVFLKDKFCPITGEPANQIHHRRGRIGDLLCDVKYWLAVSAKGHEWIEANPEESYKLGYSLLRNAKE